MTRKLLDDQVSIARVYCPDILNRLCQLESGEEDADWVLRARREIVAELVSEYRGVLEVVRDDIVKGRS